MENQRKVLRIRGFDYSQAGYYFVTFCTYNRKKLLSNLEDDQSILTPIGERVQHWICESQTKFQNLEIETFIVMPNHVHVIFGLLSDGVSLPRIVQWIKTMTTNDYLRTWKGKLWQRGYYERIVRNDRELNNIRKYIEDNPINWSKDIYNRNSTNGSYEPFVGGHIGPPLPKTTIS